MITAGLLGRKSGRGFYTYAAQDSSTVVPDAATPPEEEVGAQPRRIGAVGVAGTGTMATGIVEVFAKGGHDVIIRGRSSSRTDAALAAITRSLDKAVNRGKLSESDRDAALGRISTTTSLDDFAQVDLVVEAVAEDPPPQRAAADVVADEPFDRDAPEVLGPEQRHRGAGRVGEVRIHHEPLR